jgi:hypothetical membrane protein
MKPSWKIALLEGACVTGILTMFILPLFSLPGYSITRNTLSELGAQFTPFAWIMNLVFLILALNSVNAGWDYFEDFVLHRIALVLCALSLILMAIFNHAPADPDIPYNIKEAVWHSYFAGTAILSFTLLSLATGFVLEKQFDRAVSVAAGFSIIFLSLLTSEAGIYSGIWERLMYMVSTGWLIYILKTGK